MLLALWPLATARRDLADQLVMTLRKVMFAREAASRCVLVWGKQSMRGVNTHAPGDLADQLVMSSARYAADAARRVVSV